MLIPIHLLWNVRMDYKQKLGLLGIFSLTIVTMIIAIVKVEVTLRGPREDDVFYFLMSTIELTICKMSIAIVSP